MNNDVHLLHEPRWQRSGDDWCLLVGNRSVARIIPNRDHQFPQFHWLSLIEDSEAPDHGWHAVDFETLAMAMHDIGQWWRHMCRGEIYRPQD